MVPARRPSLRPVRRLGAVLPVFLVAVALGGSVAGCADESAATAPAATTAAGWAAATEAVVPMGGMTMPTDAEVQTAWDARPDFVRALPTDWQAAYEFALVRPDVLQWLPCYCGCGGMGHRSNLDCFFQRREVRGTFAYEEHGSFCNVCVETANLAARMLRQGSTMAEIRAAVDARFGGGVPGTDTPMPPPA